MASEGSEQEVTFCSRGDLMVGRLFLPAGNASTPALVVCHGAGESAENYAEFCRFLAEQGVASLAVDMHGHGRSGGPRYHVEMDFWVADVCAALDVLASHPRIDGQRIGGFGLSSGGTAVLEAALTDSRLKALIVLDPTVRNSLPLTCSILLRLLIWFARLKRVLTGRDLCIPLARIAKHVPLAADPEINRHIVSRFEEKRAYLPLAGATQAFFVDTIKRVGQIRQPVFVLWGEEDQMDAVSSAHLLFETLTCTKALEIIPGNGHAGHLDRHRAQVYHHAANWAVRQLAPSLGDRRQAPRNIVPPPEGGGLLNAYVMSCSPTSGWSPASPECVTPQVRSHAGPASGGSESAAMCYRMIVGEEARRLGRKQKWELLSPHLKQHGRHALAYATLQDGLEYFVDSHGYIAFITVTHPIFAPKPKRIALCDPICAQSDYERIVRHFLETNPSATFSVVSEACAEVLRGLKFKVNCIGYEPELPIQTYDTKGNWKELDLIKRARNETKREGIRIREEPNIENVNREELNAVTTRWIGTKRVRDREIWLYARRPVYEKEVDVRKFVAYDRAGQVVGFAFYDPMYRDGKVTGYSANITRTDEQRYGRLATAIHMDAMDIFRAEGKEVLNLCLAPFVKLYLGKYNDDVLTKFFFELSERFGNDIYNFRGLSFHKSKYRGVEKPLYYVSNSRFPSNDIYLAFRSADISRSYLQTLWQLTRGVLKAAVGRMNGPRNQLRFEREPTKSDS